MYRESFLVRQAGTASLLLLQKEFADRLSDIRARQVEQAASRRRIVCSQRVWDQI